MNQLFQEIRRNPLFWLLVFVPVVFAAAKLKPGAHTLLFVLSVLAIVPLAALLSHATESVAAKTGDAVGGLLNATLGNLTELVITLTALRAGEYMLVKASIAGAIVAQIRDVENGLPLRNVVDQFVMHYDVCGLSKTCFNVLHDHRGLSIHFMLDIDGTIYQTLDLKERAFHATTSNTRSVGVEIANMGAYPPSDTKVLNAWYQPDASGRPTITIPASITIAPVRSAPCQQWTRTGLGASLNSFRAVTICS